MEERILVTGASGYLASWVVEHLLREGLKVHGTVRNLHDRVKLAHLRKLAADYPHQLTLFDADLLVPKSFDAAMEGCTLVIHTASPYLIEEVKVPDEQLLRPALEGTQNVLGSVERTLSVRRVVLTSSVVALYNNAREVNETGSSLVKPDDINHSSSLASNPYAYAKTQAEQWAWQQQKKQHRWSLITIHPGAIFGPSLSRRVDSTSINMMRQFINGSFRRGVPRLWLGLVDVRNAAEAHMRAALNGEDQARYIVVSESLRLLDMARLIDAERFNITDKLPNSEAPKWLLWFIAPLVGMRRNYISNNVNFPLDFDSEASRENLKLEYFKPEKTLNDHVAQLFSDKLANC